MSVAASPVQNIQSEELLFQSYGCDTLAEVQAFLTQHPEVLIHLIQAVPHIEEAFGDGTPLVLKLCRDYDSAGDTLLTASIMTTLSAKEAMAALNNFDQSWWNSASHDLQNDLVFDVDFV